MGILFISHSSKNNERAIRVRDWLREQGWRDTFLDLDPEHGLAPGQRWQEELKKAGERCSAVIVLVSPEWAASIQCRTEALLAYQLGKKIFPVVVTPTPFEAVPVELTAHFQMADLSLPEIEADGLNRLRLGLRRAGLDPTDFPWPPPGEPNRPPYRGLRTLEEPDAAIFFGRDAQITKGLDTLRRMRDGAPEKMLVVLGASGSGKSSFLRAGLLARLARDEENFLVLPTMRPGQAALTGPAGLAGTLSVPAPVTPEAMVARFATLRQPVIERLRRYAQAGRQAYAVRPPTLILPVDQGEELFAADQAEGAAVCAALAGAIAADQNLLVLVTIRSDSFGLLQAEQLLAAVPRLPFDLPPLPLAAFKEVIEGPGRLAQPPLKVEEALTSQLVSDLDQADALPLLAFTLERLVADYGADGVLELPDYRDHLGGLGGAIRRAVEAAFAAADAGRRPRGDRAALERLARAAFIPWLLRLEAADQEPKRRVSLLREIPANARPLLAHLIDQRLLVTHARTDGETTVEVVHEAVLRNWRLLGSWIAEERETLALAETVVRAAKDWGREGSNRDSLLVHRGERLASAEALLQREDIAMLVGSDARVYLAACRETERSALIREWQQIRRQRRLQRYVGGAVLTVLAVTLIGAWLVFRGQQNLARQASVVLATAAHVASDAGRFDQAARLALLASRDQWLQRADPTGLGELGRAAQLSPLISALYGHSDWVWSAEFSPQGDRIVTASYDGTARVWQATSAGTWSGAILKGHRNALNAASFALDGKRIVTGSDDNTARVWKEGPDGSWSSTVLEGHSGSIFAASYSPDEHAIITASDDQTAIVWFLQPDDSWRPEILRGHAARIWCASFSPDGMRILTASADKTARVWQRDSKGQWLSKVLQGHGGRIWAAAFSPDSKRIITGSGDFSARIWREDSDGNWQSQVLMGHEGRVLSVQFSPDSKRAVTASADGSARIWYAGQERERFITKLSKQWRSVNYASFSPDGKQIIVASSDHNAWLWSQDANRTWSSITLAGHTGSLMTASFSPDGRRFVTGSTDNSARVWERDSSGNWTSHSLIGHKDSVKAASFSPDGSRIVTGSDDQTVRVWSESNDGKWSSVVLNGHEDSVLDASFSPDGHSVVSGSSDYTAIVWHEETNGNWSSTVLDGHEGRVWCVSFSPDGRKIVTGSDDDTARVWQIGIDGHYSSSILRGHSNWIFGVHFLQDNNKVVTASDDGMLGIWQRNLEGEWFPIFVNGSEGFQFASLSFDNTQIVAGFKDGHVEIWNIAWLIGDQARHWANILNTSNHFESTVDAVCKYVLSGTEDSAVDSAEHQTSRNSIRQLTVSDIDAAPSLIGRQGEDVCIQQTSSIAQWLATTIHNLRDSTPPPW